MEREESPSRAKGRGRENRGSSRKDLHTLGPRSLTLSLRRRLLNGKRGVVTVRQKKKRSVVSGLDWTEHQIGR